jgi:hypothetical protein
LQNAKQDNSPIEISSLRNLEISKLDQTEISDSLIEVDRKFFKNKQWVFTSNNILEIKYKIENNGNPFVSLPNLFINRGVTTGANSVFIIDTKTKNELISIDNKSKEIIKPILKGSDIKRYFIKEPSNWIIFTKRGTDLEQYPAIKTYLMKYKEELMPGKGRKAGNYEWFEIQDNTAFYTEFEKKKIVWTRLANINSFALSYQNEYTLDSTSFATYSHPEYLCGILNSKVIYFYFKLAAVIWGKDGIKWFGDYFDSIPIPDFSTNFVTEITEIVKRTIKIKQENPDSDITEFEKEIDHLVYQLYGLTEEEIKIVENS